MARPRRPQRVRHTLPVKLEGLGVALGVDVSREGFRLEVSSPLPVGSRVSGVVLHDALRLPFSGRVTWCEASPMASVWHSVGVQFEHVSDALRAFLGANVY